jgi:TMEM175 potassium channel family protein
MSPPLRGGDTHPAARLPHPGEMSSGRLEAFSDGVFAIAITLLVLDLHAPEPASVGDDGLGAALAHAWPSYFAYLVSFLVIGIIWINHHRMFSMVRRVDRPVLFVNLALLLFVSALPFPTRLLADYLTAGGDSAHVAAAVYSATMFAIGTAFTSLWLVLTRDAGLLHQHIDGPASRNALWRFSVGGLVYILTIGLSFVSAIATLAVHGALAIYYCFDQLPITLRDPGDETDAPG